MPSSTSLPSSPKLSSRALVSLKIELFYFLDEGRGEREEEPKRAETGGVLCGRRMQFQIGQIASFFSLSLSTSLSTSAAHEARYAPAGSLSRRKPDGSSGPAAKESSYSQRKEISGMK